MTPAFAASIVLGIFAAFMIMHGEEYENWFYEVFGLLTMIAAIVFLILVIIGKIV